MQLTVGKRETQEGTEPKLHNLCGEPKIVGLRMTLTFVRTKEGSENGSLFFSLSGCDFRRPAGRPKRLGMSRCVG